MSNNNVYCKLDNVYERDIDFMLMSAFMITPGFIQVFASKVGMSGQKITVLNVELSKMDASLGESDVTVILDVDGAKHGFLIEDKIDAIAMPEQHGRYVKRAEKGIKNGDYDAYNIFIFCPKKYLEGNAEAKKYENCVTYEEAKAFFSNSGEASAKVWSDMLSQALDKAKRPSDVTLNENANAFTIEYKKYIKEYYPEINVRTSDNANGYWLHIGTTFGEAYIYHKIPQGFVDLTIPSRADMIEKAKSMASWIRDNTAQKVTAEITGKSCAFRIEVPVLDINRPFSESIQDDVKKCCDAIRMLTSVAGFMENASDIRK